ncbi:pollen-specific leucine-rich repeat extensin-like protein 4 [Iris pallida]|uniref:Pollen-specific leucine-rich repeat extensin-like protein 4 n=1 Tax=Iris pallida TaxID=29817 RepID=A0AAX6FG76_IRIPA|nr:pollen-specific leucine-rich repeat extensin-like protein 4 [Iris pallida]
MTVRVAGVVDCVGGVLAMLMRSCGGRRGEGRAATSLECGGVAGTE